MFTSVLRFLLLLSLAFPAISFAGELPFSGTWTIDLRTPAEKKRNAECGRATFTLSQTKDQITGDHSMATQNCGRMNEGGSGTVTGLVIGTTAVLVVTSARNGQIVLGAAKLKGESLLWQAREEIKPGEPQGDSGLILDRGLLTRQRP
jgi:hypothetical protein